MRLLEHNEAIREYYESVKDQYPTLSFDEFRLICESPWSFVKFCIRQDEPYEINIKFFGKFRMSLKWVKKYITETIVKHSKGHISTELFNERMEVREKQLKSLEQYEQYKKANKRRSDDTRVTELLHGEL